MLPPELRTDSEPASEHIPLAILLQFKDPLSHSFPGLPVLSPVDSLTAVTAVCGHG